MMRRVIVLLAIMLAGCSPDFESFAELCRNEARVVVHDPVAWETYLKALNADHQKYGGAPCQASLS
jgi:hypothetical protein